MADPHAKGISDNPADDRPDLGGIRQIGGGMDADGMTFGIAVSRFNGALTRELLQAAVRVLRERGADDAAIDVAWVPGSFELSGVLEAMARSGKYSALMALGAVVHGDTPHAQLIGAQVTRSITDISRQYELPVIDGVITARTYDLAAERADRARGDRGGYVARAAIEMAGVFARLKNAK